MENKNIFVLETDKPSRLVLRDVDNKLILHTTITQWHGKSQNIYITNDEEIKYRDWALNILNNTVHKKDTLSTSIYFLKYFKKIILTDNEDLIKDGVQAIDDEFLEWFVKNPSCEEVITDKIFEEHGSFDISYYKIIIPSREPKQKWDINTCRYFDMEIGCEREKCICENQEPKQETLEEAAEKEFPLIDTEWCRTGACEEENLQLLGHRRSFIKGAKSEAAKNYWYTIFKNRQNG